MSILNQMQENYESMTVIQRKIADYAMKNYAGLLFMTLEDIAAAVGSSPTSVIRFTRMLGFSGYSEFLQELRKESLQKASVPMRLHKNLSRQKGSSLLKDNLNNTIQNLNITANQLSGGCLINAAQLIRNANRVFVFGTCSMTSVAHYLVSSLKMTHDNVYQLNGVGCVYAEEFLSLQEGDTAILFLFPRYEFLLVKLLPLLREKQVKIIVFTAPVYDTIADMADVFIPCQLSGFSSRDSLTPIMFAIDCLTSEVSSITDYEKLERLAENMETMVTKFYCGL